MVDFWEDDEGVMMDFWEDDEGVMMVQPEVSSNPFYLDLEAPAADPFVIDLDPFEVGVRGPVVVEFPAQLPVETTHAVPWSYQSPKLVIDGKKEPGEEVSAVTRSGRVVPEPVVDANVSKGKEVVQVPKAAVSNKEVEDFLKMIKRSEYSVVDQLAKLPSQISMLSLLLTSELHREAILKVLNTVHVPKDIPTEKLAGMVGNVLTTSLIYFTDEDMTSDGRDHNKALFISVRCERRHLPRVMVDNGSALNICPLITLQRLGISHDRIRNSPMVIRGFDGAKRQTMGEVDLFFELGPAAFTVVCQVVSVVGVYNLLLGRPWIHASGSVPSSLHQVIKFVYDDQLVTIFSEDDHAMVINSGAENGESSKTPVPFLVYDIVSQGQKGAEHESDGLAVSNTTMMIAKELIRGGFQVGKGLGRNLQGILQPIELTSQLHTFGLGFHPTIQQLQEVKAERRKEKEGKGSPMIIPPLRVTFPKPATIMGAEEEEAIDDIVQGVADLFVAVVQPKQPEGSMEEFPLIAADQLQNWSSCALPVRREFR